MNVSKYGNLSYKGLYLFLKNVFAYDNKKA
jgi:hypothetical protein